MVKSMVAHSVIESESGDMHSFLDKRKQDVAKKTLGQVVGDLTTDLLSLPVNEEGQQQENPGDPTKIWFRTSFRIEMSPDDHQRTQQRLAELVELRNKLVHHFIELHDIWTVAGCASADAYLDDCFRLIDERFEELRKIAQHQDEARKEMANVMQSGEFEDFLLHGILPGGTGAIWSSCTIVNLLRDAEATLAVDEWTPLARAIEYISGREPSHTPKRYGCSSWRQVLHESAIFTIRREQSEPGVAKETWYRSRSL
ncbi:MAG: OST-HTH/LOTUS domain-containing protein [Azonexus sp.]